MDAFNKVWIYRAAYLCERCVADVKSRTSRPEHVDESNEHSYDSDVWPKGPFPTDAIYVDVPVHCDSCGALALCPLSNAGVDYVSGKIREACAMSAPGPALDAWCDYYDSHLDDDLKNLYGMMKHVLNLEKEVKRLRADIKKNSKTLSVARRKPPKSSMGARVDVKGRPASISKRGGRR